MSCDWIGMVYITIKLNIRSINHSSIPDPFAHKIYKGAGNVRFSNLVFYIRPKTFQGWTRPENAFIRLLLFQDWTRPEIKGDLKMSTEKISPRIGFNSFRLTWASDLVTIHRSRKSQISENLRSRMSTESLQNYLNAFSGLIRYPVSFSPKNVRALHKTPNCWFVFPSSWIPPRY